MKHKHCLRCWFFFIKLRHVNFRKNVIYRVYKKKQTINNGHNFGSTNATKVQHISSDRKQIQVLYPNVHVPVLLSNTAWRIVEKERIFSLNWTLQKGHFHVSLNASTDMVDLFLMVVSLISGESGKRGPLYTFYFGPMAPCLCWACCELVLAVVSLWCEMFSEVGKAQCFQWYHQTGSASTVQMMFQKAYGDIPRPSRAMIIRCIYWSREHRLKIRVR